MKMFPQLVTLYVCILGALCCFNIKDLPEYRVTDMYGENERGTVLKRYEWGMFIRDRDIMIPPEKHEATMIFLHSAVSHGAAMRAWLEMIQINFTFRHVKVLFPTAGENPYALFSGEVLSYWIDRKEVRPNETEMIEVLRRSSEDLTEFIKDEMAETGIPLNKFIIGGFSQGGEMAMHMVFRYFPQVAGVFALSSYISYDSQVYKHFEKTKDEPILYPPLLVCTGDRDRFVQWQWVKETVDRLRKYGISTSFHVIPKAAHQITVLEINLLMRWVNKLVPQEHK